MKNLEIRNIKSELNVTGRTVSGYAIRFNEDSVDLGGFVERISPQALTYEQINDSDIFALFNHDNEKVLARSGAGTLKLELRPDGLWYEFECPNTQAGNDLIEHLSRGEMYGTSFGFYTPMDGSGDEWTRDAEGNVHRLITNIEELVEISPVFNPAYPTTSVSARSLEMINKLNSEMKEDEIVREEPKDEDVKPEESQNEEQTQEETPKEEETKEEPKDEEMKPEETQEETQDETQDEETPKEEEKEETQEDKPEDNEEEKPEKEEKNINTNKSKTMEKRFSLLKAIRSIVNENKLDAVSQAVVNAGQEECRNSGLSFAGQIQIPVGDKMEERAVPVVTVTAEGEDVVVTDFTNILEPLRAKNVLASAGATFLTGLVGDLQIPSMSAEQVFWEGEVTETSSGQGSFSHIKMAPRRLSAYIDVSKQFLVQDSLGAEELIRRDLINAINTKLEATILGEDAAAGNVPAGIFYNVSPSEVSTFADLCNLEADVEEVNINGSMKYILSPKAKAGLRAMPKSEKHTQLVLDVDNIDGTPFETTTNMGQNMFAYGDWSNLYIGQWGPIDLLIDPYTQATKGTVRIVVNAFFDYAVVRDGAIVYAEYVAPEGD